MKKIAPCMLLFGALLLVPATRAVIHEFNFALSGAQEVSGGDPDGTGTAMLLLDDATNQISWEFTAENIVMPLIGAHIHEAPFGVNGGVVVNFNAMLTGSGLVSALVPEILANPTNYYVNLHNEPFPGGAIRGQLPRMASVPDSLGFGWACLPIVALLFARKRARRRD